MSAPRMLAVVVNHNHTANARALVKALQPHVATIALDSGSILESDDAALFARCLPNVYYNGLLNAAHAEARRRGVDVLFWICSDVGLAEPESAVRHAQAAFAAGDIGLYAPAMNVSGHRHMRLRRGRNPCSVPFVEGVCFAVRLDLLAALGDIDLRINALGWGTDAYLGYLAWRKRLRAIVDHRWTAVHANRCGYDTGQARAQRDAWFATQAREAQLFRWVTGWPPVKTRLGWRMASPMLRLLRLAC